VPTQRILTTCGLKLARCDFDPKKLRRVRHSRLRLPISNAPRSWGNKSSHSCRIDRRPAPSLARRPPSRNSRAQGPLEQAKRLRGVFRLPAWDRINNALKQGHRRGLAMVESVALAAPRSDGRRAAVDGPVRGAAAAVDDASKPPASDRRVRRDTNVGATRTALRQRGRSPDYRQDDSRLARIPPMGL
jgi:hypothetical protein